MRILLIEDDKATAETIAEQLRHHYAVDIANLGKEGEVMAHQNEYDLLIVDFNLLDTDGVTISKKLRDDDIRTPILILTGRTEIQDKVFALDSGADDYLTKPFSFDELSARIRALMRRRADGITPHSISVDDLTLDISSNIVTRAGRKITLRRKELQLLEFLMRNRGRTVTRDMIMEHVWESRSDPLTNTVDVHIKYLRDQIDKGFVKKLIKTVYGMGYKIDA